MESDKEWERYFTEMATFKMPVQLRQLFVTILYYCEPHCAANLFERFKNNMSEDFQHRFRSSPMVAAELSAYAINLAKADIERQLKELGKSLLDYGIALAVFDGRYGNIVNNGDLWDPVEEKRKGKRMKRKMRGKTQEKVVYRILLKVHKYLRGKLSKSGVFIDGPAGTEKPLSIRVVPFVSRKPCKVYDNVMDGNRGNIVTRRDYGTSRNGFTGASF